MILVKDELAKADRLIDEQKAVLKIFPNASVIRSLNEKDGIYYRSDKSIRHHNEFELECNSYYFAANIFTKIPYYNNGIEYTCRVFPKSGGRKYELIGYCSNKAIRFKGPKMALKLIKDDVLYRNLIIKSALFISNRQPRYVIYWDSFPKRMADDIKKLLLLS